MKWQYFVNPEKLPDNGVLLARVSDNVLDDDCWTPFPVIINNGIITFIASDDEHYMVGKHKEILAEWTQYDTTGEHPETYYELFL